MSGKVIDGPVTIRGDLVVTGRLNKGLDTAQSNAGQALQVIQGVLQPVVTQPNTVPQSGDVRMYGQNVTINGNVVPGGTDGYFQIDEYINGAWQHLFEVQPSTTGNANVLDLFISGRLFARDSLLSAPGRFFFNVASPFGTDSIEALAYGNGVFVAGAFNGEMARSTDGGLTWGSLITSPFGTDTIAALAYGNGVFVAGATSGKMARSTDGGLTWGSLITNPFGTDYIYALAYGNGVFVAGATSGKMARSTDGGLTWGSLITNPFGTDSIYALAYGNGVFVAGGGGGEMARSTDGGLTWGSLITNPFGTDSIHALAYGNGVFVASGDSGNMARSTDGGLTWGSLITNPFGTDYIHALAYGNGVFVAGATNGECSRSLDLGLTWGITYGANNTAQILDTYIYAIATNGNGRFVVGGYGTTYSIAYSDYVEAGAGIVASGSNTNGSYVQFADGTMECWAEFTAAVPLTVYTQNFPAAFIAKPILVCSRDDASYYTTDLSGWAASATEWSCISPTATTRIAAMHAFGRWK